MKIKIGIWGSCCTRDIFRSIFNNYKEYFEIISSLERVSAISLMEKEHSIEFNEEDIQIYPLDARNKFRSDVLRRDLSKNSLKSIGENIDYLFIDEFFEAYFGIIKINDTYITNNRWDLPETKFYETINQDNILTLDKNFDEYFELWKISCDNFFDYFHENFPNVKIILNKVRLTSNVVKNDGSYYVEEEFESEVEKYNPLIKLLEDYIEKCHDVIVIDSTKNLAANENHIWGKGVVHYHDEFYIKSFEKILEITNGNQLKNKVLNQIPNSDQENNNLENLSLDSKLNEFLEIKKYLFEESSVYNNFIDVDRLKDYFKYISENNYNTSNLSIMEASFNELIKINKFISQNKKNLEDAVKNIENGINSQFFNENAEFLRKYFDSRIDIKNYGDKTNNIRLLFADDSSLRITRPSWFNDDKGIGTIVNSTKGYLNLSFKCVNDGKLIISFKAIDYRDKNGNRIPIYIDYTDIVINDEIIVDESTVSWHDNPFIFQKEVKNGEIINIEVKWCPLNDKSNIFLVTDYEKLLKNFYEARIDVKNYGLEDNNLILIGCDDNLSNIYKPSWFKDKSGSGTTIFSRKGTIHSSFKCVNDGELKINFRSNNLLDNNENKLPIFIDYTRIRINGKDLIENNFISWFDKPFVYKQKVKNNQIINIEAEWNPLSPESNMHLLQDNNYDDLNIYSEARFDIKNYGNETNNIVLLNSNTPFYVVSRPQWFTDSKGIGYTINSLNKELNLSFKCINDGKLEILFRAIDYRDRNNNRIPIYIDYTEIEIDGESIIDGSTVLWHDNELCYNKLVKDGQIIKIKLKWRPLNENSNCQNILIDSKNKTEEIEKLKKELEELTNENIYLRNLKEELLNSNSWKKTSSLRKIKNFNNK